MRLMANSEPADGERSVGEHASEPLRERLSEESLVGGALTRQVGEVGGSHAAL